MDQNLLNLIDTLAPQIKNRPNGFGITVAELAKKRHIAVSTAARILNDLVTEGVLVCEKYQCDDRVMNVYSQKQQAPAG